MTNNFEAPYTNAELASRADDARELARFNAPTTALFEVIAEHNGDIVSARVETVDGVEWVHATVEFSRSIDSIMFGYTLRTAWKHVDRRRTVEYRAGEEAPAYVYRLAFERGHDVLFSL